LLLGSAAAKAQTLQATVPASDVRSGAPRGIVTLEPETPEQLAARSLVEGTKLPQTLPANFRRFDAVSQGQIGETQTLSLRFSAPAQLLAIESTPDFKVEPGGSCVAGLSYTANATCTLLVRSTPQGPGRRLGKLAITNSVDAEPLNVGLGGFGYSPTISFTPSLISTVPGTYVNNAGLLNGALNLAIDAGDNLYMADTGNGQVRYIDSSGVVRTPYTGFGPFAAVGVAVDAFGDIFFDVPTQNALYEIYDYGYVDELSGLGSDTCTYAAPCPITNESVIQPGEMTVDSGGQIFFVEGTVGGGAAVLIPLPYPPNYYRLYDPFTFQTPNQGAIAVDADDDIYSYATSGYCAIALQTFDNAVNSEQDFRTVAGGRTCGFSGDGGQADSAEISLNVSQMTFDVAGNLYFSDTGNQRVRRVDADTGIITTIAGDGIAGYTGDGGPATAASLSAPTGVAVDSQGQVYIISNSATTGTAQVVRKVGTVGALNFGSGIVGLSSAAQTVQLANTGNSALDFTHVGFSSGNTSDFVIDPNTTSCNFSVALAAGRSCKIGFIFTPSAAGVRSAVLTITDDTIAGVNTIQLSGTGTTSATLKPGSFSFASTAVGASSAAQVATLSNTGQGVLSISSIALSGTGASSYSETTTCGTTLAIGASCTVSVVFKPKTTGTLTATVTVTDNAIGGKQTLTLTGVGAAAAAKPSLAPTSLTLAPQAVGTASAPQTITLANTGKVALGVTSIKMTGTDAGDYAVANNCGGSVAAAGSCTITLTFKPTATGTRTASVSVETSTGTPTLAVTGTAVAAKPKVSLTSAANPVAASHTVQVKVEVKGSSAAAPTGKVKLMEGSKLWAEGVLAGGTIALQVQGLPIGVHLLTAVYMGDGTNGEKSSEALRQVVGQ